LIAAKQNEPSEEIIIEWFLTFFYEQNKQKLQLFLSLF
jgi:hypothetical protein